MNRLSAAWERNRPDLLRYVSRLLLDPDTAEDVIQQTAVRALNAPSPPQGDVELRKWLFRITSNLAIDELRRRRRWSERALLDAREEAERDPDFVAASLALRGTQEVNAIAQQHLAFCFSCVLRSLQPQRAAALLLVELYGFTLQEAASILGASRVQVKNWLQEARATLVSRHVDRCALVQKKGVCYQCSELATFFDGTSNDPLSGTNGTVEDRLRVVRAPESDLGVWHRRLLRVIEEQQTDTKPIPNNDVSHRDPR
jgi:RNA polymerase sigma-70 factor, ECF subfamily